jgi:hypothetical protein
VIDGNKLSWPATGGGNVKEQARTVSQIPECKAVADQLAALGNQNRNPDPTPNASDLPKLRQFAACMREHGLPDWPDPNADGTFPIAGTPLQSQLDSEPFFAAVDACKHLYDKRIVTS